MLNDWIGLVLVVILVLINGFFVAAEFSLVSVRKTRIAERVARGDTGRQGRAAGHLTIPIDSLRQRSWVLRWPAWASAGSASRRCRI